MKITFDPINGECFPDGLIEERIINKLKLGQDFSISNELGILVLRVLVKRKLFDNIYIEYIDKQSKVFMFGIDIDGNLEYEEYPQDFDREFTKYLLQLL